MKKLTYPNYSVYMFSSGQLLNPHGKKREVLYDYADARADAEKVLTWMRSPFRKTRPQVAVVRYEGPYDSEIVAILPGLMP